MVMQTAPLSIALAAVMFALPCAAQGQSAEELFHEGRAALDRGELDVACSKLAESLRLSGQGGPRLSLAECEERRGHLALALEQLDEAVRVLPAGSVQGTSAAERRAALEPRVPTLTIDVDARAPADMRIDLDGKPGRAGGVRLDPGRHTVVTSAAGCPPKTFPVSLSEGDRRHLHVDIGACGGASADDPVASSGVGSSGRSNDATTTRRTAGFVVGGVGVAGILLFGVTGALALGKQSTVDAHCHAKKCDATGLAAASDGRALDAANAIFLGVGAAGLGVGAVLVLTAPTRSAKAALGLGPTPGGFAVRLSAPLDL